MLTPLPDLFTNGTLLTMFSYLYRTAFIWLPLILAPVLWHMWIMYRRAMFFASQTYVLLEIKLPKEIFKSPLAMEFFINSLYQTLGEGNWYEKYWKGSVRAWFSLEIVSIDGGVHFFIWSRKGFKNSIEANLYSQFPGIEIYEVPDYTLPVSYNSEVNIMWASEYDLKEKDAFPIKTYIDYGMDKDPKEEYKIDPMTPLIEALGSMGKGHQAWIQILIRSHKAEDKDPKGGGKLVDLKWKKSAEEEINKLFDKLKDKKDEATGKDTKGRLPTEGEKDLIHALERSISKTGFDVGIRSIYIAPKDVYNPSYIGGIVGGILHFNSSYNGFKPARGSAPKYKLFPWKNRRATTINIEKQDMLDAYKRRAYFYEPFKRPHFVLNTEELATLFHFPGGVSATPTFARVTSKKAEAPANLPQ